MCSVSIMTESVSIVNEDGWKPLGRVIVRLNDRNDLKGIYADFKAY